MSEGKKPKRKKSKTTKIAEESYTDARNILLSLAREMGEKWPDKVLFFSSTTNTPGIPIGTIGITLAPVFKEALNDNEGAKDER